MESTLTIAEQAQLAQHEEVIERGLQTFAEVGAALMAIRDGRLYKAQFSTFEAYLAGRWNMSRQQGYRLIDAASVAEDLSPMGDILPSSERQARPLARLDKPEQRREAWQLAVDTAPEGRITGAHVQEVVRQFSSGEVPHVTRSSGNNEWYTPPEYIEAARQVMGDIDLDPASSEIANSIVGAKQYYTAEDDGLLYTWTGRVWMNPPYATPLIGQFANKLALHVKYNDVPEACVLVNNATETGWFNTILELASAVCFVRGRVRFIDQNGDPSGAPLQGQAVLYIGPNTERFAWAFGDFGTVLYARKD